MTVFLFFLMSDQDYSEDDEYSYAIEADRRNIRLLIEKYKNAEGEDERNKIEDVLCDAYGIGIDKLADLIEKTVKSAVKEAVKETKEDDKGYHQTDSEGDNNKSNDESEKLLTYLNLPKDNFIMRYIDIMKTLTSAYPEWHFAMAISILSIISDKKLKISLRHKILYPNIWFFLLGLSTISQKTTAIRNLGEEVITRLKTDEFILRKLPGSFSPEGFIDDLSQHHNGYLWKDEAGDLLQSMEKEYMKNMRDLLCELYECKTFHRRLKKGDILIHDPFINMVLATTPDNFKAYTELLDLTSGWLMRYLYSYPEYDKDWIALTQRTKEDDLKITELVKILRGKIKCVSSTGKEGTSFEFDPGSLDIFQKWSEKMYYRVMKNKSSIESSIMGRLEDYTLKLAMLFTFGEGNFKITISKDIMESSCNLIENYFLPQALKVAEMVEIDEKHNSMDKILGVIKRNGGKIDRSRLLKKVHPIKSRELDDLCSTLLESGEIKMYVENRIKYYELSGK